MTGEREQGLTGLAEVRKERKPSIINTALLTGVLYIGTDLFVSVLEKHTPIRTGTGASEREIEDSFHDYRWYLTQAIVAAPILEETFFRKIPQIVLKRKADNLLSAVTTSAVFAGLHNVKNKGKGGYETKKIPLHQFAGGLLFWYLSRNRGISHSMIAHAATNSLAFAHHHLDEKTQGKG